MGNRTATEANKRTRIGEISGMVGIFCNFFLAGSKLAAGQLSGSVSITADGMNNLSDAASSIVTLIGFKLAERPADREHPFGHARYEYLASLTVAVMVLFVGFELAKSSVEKILHPESVEISAVFLAVLMASIIVKAGLMVFYTGMGRKINSVTLLAAAEDSRNDVLTTAVVMGAAGVEHVTDWQVDRAMGILLSLFIFWNGLGLIKKTVSPLLGEGVKPDFRRDLTKYIRTFPQVLGSHDLIVHDYGPNRTYASIHLEFDKDDGLLECHEIIDLIERTCLERWRTHLVVHLDPVITDDVQINCTRKWVEDWLKRQDDRLSIHDFRMHSYEESVRLVFDLVVPERLQGKEETLKDQLERALDQLRDLSCGRRYQLDITFEPEMEE